MPASQQTDYPQRSVAIIKAILGGERDPRELAAYRDWRVKAGEAEIAARLEGNRQEDVLFSAEVRIFQQQRMECDRQLE